MYFPSSFWCWIFSATFSGSCRWWWMSLQLKCDMAKKAKSECYFIQSIFCNLRGCMNLWGCLLLTYDGAWTISNLDACYFCVICMLVDIWWSMNQFKYGCFLFICNLDACCWFAIILCVIFVLLGYMLPKILHLPKYCSVRGTCCPNFLHLSKK